MTKSPHVSMVVPLPTPDEIRAGMVEAEREVETMARRRIETDVAPFAAELRDWWSQTQRHPADHSCRLVLIIWDSYIVGKGMTSLRDWIARTGSDRVAEMIPKIEREMEDAWRVTFDAILKFKLALLSLSAARNDTWALPDESMNGGGGLAAVRRYVAAFDQCLGVYEEVSRLPVHHPDVSKDLVEGFRGEVEFWRAEIPSLVEEESLAQRVARLARRNQPAEAIEKPSIECAEDGCTRDRVFFDDDGNGYCKRHANDRGIRPRGKA